MSTMYSIGAMNQTADAFEKAGFSSEDLTKLRQFKNLSGIKDLINGKAELIYPNRKWREENGVIYFSVTFEEIDGLGWIKYLPNKYHVSDYAERVLRSSDFKQTGKVTMEIAVLKGLLFKDGDRVIEKIRAEAASRRFTVPSIEVACLIRQKFTDQELNAMGLHCITVMHEPVNYFEHYRLLDVSSLGTGNIITVSDGKSNSEFPKYYGFAFAVPAN